MADIKVKTIENDEEYLRGRSSLVKVDDKELKSDIEKLEEYCINHEVMAMAAVQLGIKKRIIYLKNTNLEIINSIQENNVSEEDKNFNEARVLINPVILESEGLTEYWEACASCLDNFSLVRRPYKIEVEYQDVNGVKHNEDFIGFEATVLSHEIDHLDGILHMDIAKETMELPKEERKKWRVEHPYNIISKTGNYKDLKDMYK